MSDPIFPLAVWEEGTLQNDVPANDNSLRLEAILRGALSVANSPGVSVDGTVYIVGAAPAGAFSTFDEDDLTIYYGGTWYAWAPVTGLVVYIADTPYQWDAGWTDVSGGGGGSNNVSIVTEASPFTINPGTHGGRNRYVRAAGDVTFNTSQSYTAGDVFNIRATASIELLVTGVTLTAPAGGTLELDADMAVSVIMTTSSAGDVIGQTVPAP